jgi:hypothetical protein
VLPWPARQARLRLSSPVCWRVKCRLSRRRAEAAPGHPLRLNIKYRTRAHAELRALSRRISIHALEYSLTISPLYGSPWWSIFYRSGGKSYRRLRTFDRWLSRSDIKKQNSSSGAPGGQVAWMAGRGDHQGQYEVWPGLTAIRLANRGDWQAWVIVWIGQYCDACLAARPGGRGQLAYDGRAAAAASRITKRAPESV